MNPQHVPPDRRHFLGQASAAAIFLAAHGCADATEPKSPTPPARADAAGPRIRRLELLTAAPLAKMKEFYHTTLGLAVADDKADRLSIAAGGTTITFRPAPADEGKPFYHFAFNIPENKVRAAHDWQAKRTHLLPIPEALRDPKYPAGVVDYRHWNAHSVFFFDPAENVVEYIGRHDLKNAAAGDFGPADILYASEIALVVDDVPAAVTKLKEGVGVESYRGSSDQFAAVGDEVGLLLVMKRGRVISFDAAEKKAVSVFPTAATVRGAKRGKIGVGSFPYEVVVEDLG
jgi:hypothetical protein